MAGVDAELRWGDEAIELTSHALDEVITPALGPFSLRPFVQDGPDDILLTIPARADAFVRTANGMRDMSALRVLGQLAPHPDLEGAAQVRLRRLRDADTIPRGVVLTDRIEAWIRLDGWWLRVRLDDDVAPPLLPRFEPRALRTGLALSAFVVTFLAGVLSAFGAVDSPPPQLELASVEVRARLPPVQLLPAERASWLEETKQDVTPRAIGGGSFVDPYALPTSAPARRVTTPAGSLATEASSSANETEPRAAAWTGPAEGHGGGLGQRLTTRPPRMRFGRVAGQPSVHCQRTWSGRCRSTIDERARRSMITSVVRRHLRALRACYERGLAHQPGLAGGVTLSWSIASDGVVRNVEVSDDELRSLAVAECMRRRADEWRFPSWAGPAEVSYPFLFHASD